MFRKTALWLVVLAAMVLGAADTIAYTPGAARLPNMELCIAILVYDVSADDSVGDSLFLEVQGRNALDNAPAALADTTTWSTVYFNYISAPGLATTPATYPAVDSVVKCRLPDSSWIFVPTISTPLFDEIRAKVTVTNDNNRPLSDTNSRIFIQILQRKETPYGKPYRIEYSKTLVGP